MFKKIHSSLIIKKIFAFIYENLKLDLKICRIN